MKSILICLVLLVGTFSAKAQEISYTVYNDLDSLPLTDIPVELHLRKRRTEEFLFLAKTDSAGTVVFKDLEKGSYSIHIKHPDFESEYTSSDLKKDEVDEGKIYMHHSPAAISAVLGDMVMDYNKLLKMYADSIGKDPESSFIQPTDEENLQLRRQLAELVNYPMLAVEEGIQGKVYVAILCNSQHEILKLAIIKSADEILDLEAMYALFRMKRLPIQQDDEHAYMIFRLPINFNMM